MPFYCMFAVISRTCEFAMHHSDLHDLLDTEPGLIDFGAHMLSTSEIALMCHGQDHTVHA